MERERSAASCVAMLLMGWGRIQLAAARASKSDFSHYNPSCLGEIKYLITACIMCSVLHSLLKALTVLSRALKAHTYKTMYTPPKIKIFYKQST